jgi:AraC family transcriptional regulator of adaptative response/methylated-DNA-[protein]-cysteine methyltransferase
MIVAKMPPQPEMYKAFRDRDTSYDGLFVTAVRTTGIFCKPSCPAKKPQRKNVEFYASVRAALLAGYRPCKRCRPTEPGGHAPPWLRDLLTAVEADPTKRWSDAALRDLSIDPSRVRRWFRRNHGMTFHAYQRARRLALAFGQIRDGADVTGTAYDHGYESLSGFRQAFARVFGDTPHRTRSAPLMAVTRLPTPVGPMVAAATEDGVCLLEFADRRALETQIVRLRARLQCVVALDSNGHLDTLAAELERYFAGELRDFTVPLVTPGTAFQRAAWSSLQTIPYGETRTYQQQARAIGNPPAVRAVGRANGDNRVAIVIPCHRVVRQNGELSGYGGGLWRKQFLLDHERRHA